MNQCKRSKHQKSIQIKAKHIEYYHVKLNKFYFKNHLGSLKIKHELKISFAYIIYLFILLSHFISLLIFPQICSFVSNSFLLWFALSSLFLYPMFQIHVCMHTHTLTLNITVQATQLVKVGCDIKISLISYIESCSELSDKQRFLENVKGKTGRQTELHFILDLQFTSYCSDHGRNKQQGWLQRSYSQQQNF